MPLRLSWKTLFYDRLLPSLARKDLALADARLCRLGSFVQRHWRPRRKVARQACFRAQQALALNPSQLREFQEHLGRNTARLLARDFLLDGRDDREVEQRFLVEGYEHVLEGLAAGKGLIILGSHLGAYVPALHWLYRQDLPLRSMIQRPRHVSVYLQKQLDQRSASYPSSSLFLRRDLSRRDAAERILRGRGALREGLALYLCGDISTPGGRTAPWFGQHLTLLDHWTHLARSTGATVVPLFATFEDEGTYRLCFSPALPTGSESGSLDPMDVYLQQLEDVVTADPAQAVPYWTWPSYQPNAVNREAGSPTNHHRSQTRAHEPHRAAQRPDGSVSVPYPFEIGEAIRA